MTPLEKAAPEKAEPLSWIFGEKVGSTRKDKYF